jgi:Lrp/AsnC family transcriptional regulator for asnA, asnC and gidA
VQDDVIRLVAVLNPTALGYDVVADIFLEVEQTRLEEIATRLAEMQEVSYVGLTTGERDISVQVFVPSIDALYRFLTEQLSVIPGVVNTTTYIVPRVLKWLHHWALPDDFLQQEAARSSKRRRATGERASNDDRHHGSGRRRRSQKATEIGAEP